MASWVEVCAGRMAMMMSSVVAATGRLTTPPMTASKVDSVNSYDKS
jgi:hypothetical protein